MGEAAAGGFDGMRMGGGDFGGGGMPVPPPEPIVPPQAQPQINDQALAEMLQRAQQQQGVVQPPPVAMSPLDRSKLAAELQNPAVRDRLMALTHSEVGSQGPQAQQAFQETLFNRAAARNQTLADTLQGRYWPRDGRAEAAAARIARNPDLAKPYDATLKEVIGGSNLAKYATGNASGSVGFNGGPQAAAFGGERFGIEGPDRKWAQRMQAAGVPLPPVPQQMAQNGPFNQFPPTPSAGAPSAPAQIAQKPVPTAVASGYQLPPSAMQFTPPGPESPSLNPSVGAAPMPVASALPQMPARPGLADVGDPMRQALAPTGQGVADAMGTQYEGAAPLLPERGPLAPPDAQSRLAQFSPRDLMGGADQNIAGGTIGALAGRTAGEQSAMPGFGGGAAGYSGAPPAMPPDNFANIGRFANAGVHPDNGLMGGVAGAAAGQNAGERVALPGFGGGSPTPNTGMAGREVVNPAAPTLAQALQQQNKIDGGSTVAGQPMPDISPRHLADAGDPMRSQLAKEPWKMDLKALGNSMRLLSGKMGDNEPDRIASVIPQKPPAQINQSQGSGRMRRFRSAFPIEPQQT